MRTEDIVRKLLDAQDFLNAKFDKKHGPDWRQGDYPYADYVWVECGELLNHHGGIFHYKSIVEDQAQVTIELLDILHFGLSVLLQKDNMTAEQIAFRIDNAENSHPAGNDINHYIRAVAKAALKSVEFDVHWFTLACNAYNLSFRDIARLYFAKYALCRLRIDNGIIEGNYQKIWNGQEDNVYLEMVLEDIDEDEIPAEQVEDEVYSRLKACYDAL